MTLHACSQGRERAGSRPEPFRTAHRGGPSPIRSARSLHRSRRFVFGLSIAVVLSGCTNLAHELKTDPAIVGTTGFWFQAGVDASPSTAGIPLPKLSIGYGTVWRVGPSDSVTINVGSSGSNSAADNAAPGSTGNASLTITTRNTSKVLAAQLNAKAPDQAAAETAAVQPGEAAR